MPTASDWKDHGGGCWSIEIGRLLSIEVGRSSGLPAVVIKTPFHPCGVEVLAMKLHFQSPEEAKRWALDESESILRRALAALDLAR